MSDLDMLWERIRGGDRRAARELVDHFIAEGDEEQVQAASRAIGRHFDREARELLRRAHLAEGEERRVLTAEALEALTTAAVATRLPELIRASLANPGAPAATGAGLPVPSLPPVTELTARGVNGGVDLSWRPPSDLAVTGLEVIVYRNSLVVQQSAELAATASGYAVRELTNGVTYTFVVKTLAADLLPGAAQVNGTAGLVDARLPAASGLTATPANRSLRFDWSDPETGAGVAITGYKLVLTGENLSREANVPAADEAKVLAAGARSYTFNDLQNGTAYTLALQTVGTVGGVTDQLGETASLSAIPGVSGAPSLPPVTELTARGVNGGVDLSWRPPSDLAVTGLEVIVYRNSLVVQQSAELAATVSGYAVRELTNGVTYTFVVKTLAADLLPGAAQVNGTAGLVDAALPAASGLTATPANRSLRFDWSDPETGAGVAITGYKLVLTGENLSRETNVPAADEAKVLAAGARSYTFNDLQNGTAYTLALQTVGTVGGVTDQLGETASLSAIPGASGPPFVPRVPALRADPLLFLDQHLAGEIASAEELRAEALSIAQKWRYEYLKQKAMGAAQEALAYDRQIVDLMSMALQKGLAAETQLTPVILAVIDNIGGDIQKIGDIATNADVVEAIDSLGDAVASSVLLTAILEWLARRDALDVWIELFEALIDDASDFDKSLTHTKDFLDRQYDSSVLGRAIKEIARLQLARIGPVVDAAVRPLREAVAELIGAASKDMGAAFAAFDLPILMRDGGKVDVPNVNPLLKSLASLASAVDKLETALTRAIREELKGVADGNNKALFRKFMIAYVVTPVLAALAVSMAGGPLAAGAITAAVAIGAQALLHKVARWVLGPLQDPVEELEKKVAKAFRALQKAIASEASLTLSDPGPPLKLLADELRLIRTLLPRAFVDDLAALLAEARRLTLASGLLHALGAERALGYDQATAFDRILPSYASSFTPASLLPGGGDNGLFAGAALLRDLDRLDQDLIRMTDSRDVEITRRLSLFQLLGGVGDPMQATGTALGRFADFLRTGQTAVEIRPETLLDPVSPGMYRPIVESVSVVGLARAPVASSLAMASGLSVTVSHSGRSSMRVRRDANASAPPIALPAGLVDETSYVLGTTYAGGTTSPFAPRSLEAAVASIINSIPADQLSWGTIRTACLRKLPKAVGDLANLLALRPVSASASSAQPSNPPGNAIDGERVTYWASMPQSKSAAFIEVDLGATYGAIVGARLWPRSGFAGWPHTWWLDVVDGGSVRRVQTMQQMRIEGVGREAIYVQFAPLSGRSLRFTTRMTSEEQQVCEVADIQVVAKNVSSPFLPPAPVEAAVAAVLRRMTWPSGEIVVDAAAVTIANTLRTGVPAQALRGLADVGDDPASPGASRAAYSSGRTKLLSHVAKWAGARWTQDPDPNVHGLGFVRLDQTVAPGAATFDLFPADEAASGSSVVLRPIEPRSAAERVYAPLQNLGLGGVLQIEAPGAASALIADIILEVRMRACYDPELAATVRGNQQQRSQQIGRMVDLGAESSRVLQLGAPKVGTTVTEPHTAQFSFRTNRDRILQASIAGAQVKKGTIDLPAEPIEVDGLVFTPGTPEVAPLGVDAPFSYFGAAQPREIALVFTRDAAAMTLGKQLGQIVITPAALGVDVALLDALTADDDKPMLTGLSVAILPTHRRQAKRQYPIAGPVSPLLQPLLPAAWTSDPKKVLPRLSMLSRPKAVPLASLWPVAGGTMVVTVDVGTMIAEQQLYDIIFSVTCNVPLLTAQTTSADFF